MTQATHDDPTVLRVVELRDEGELITATDTESGVASSGRSKSEALAMLSEALRLHDGEGEEIADEDAFLRDIGIDPEDIEEIPFEDEPEWFK